jgi:hypothetical protein
MPITIDEIKRHLDQLGVRHQTPDPAESGVHACGAYFTTESYVDTEGDHALLVMFAVSEDGDYLEVYAPMAMDASSCKHKGALFGAMLHVAFMTKHVQLEYDADDGEVRFAIDLPVCDGTVTTEQVSCMTHVLVRMLEQYYPVFKLAMDTGKVDFSKRWAPEAREEAEEEAATAEADSEPIDLEALVESMGGIDKLEEALRELRSQGGKT